MLAKNHSSKNRDAHAAGVIRKETIAPEGQTRLDYAPCCKLWKAKEHRMLALVFQRNI
jgi:hypothetical protein